MNIYNTSHIGQMPLWLDDFRFIIDMFKPFMEQLAKAVAKTENMVLTGCTETISGGLSTVTAGYTLIAGELCYFRGGTIAIAPNEFAIFTINQTINHDGDRTFGDGTVHEDIYIIREAQLEKVDDHEQPEGYCSVSANGLSLFRQIYEPKFAKKTAFNKDFGTEVGQILPIGTHGVGDGILIYEGQDDGVNSVPVKTGFNKNFGVVAGTVAEGNHNHVGVYKPNFTENTAFNKDFGTEVGQILPIGTHGVGDGILIYEGQDDGVNSVPVKTGFNKNFGVVAGTVAEGDHGHASVYMNLSQPINLQSIPWVSPGLTSNWVNFSGFAIKYRKFAGLLQIIGIISGGDTNSVAFTLLNGYRPANEQWHAVFGSPNTNFINIETNGDVRISDSEITFFNLLIPLDY